MNTLVALCAVGADKILGNEIKHLGYKLAGIRVRARRTIKTTILDATRTISLSFTKGLRPRGAPRSVRAGARMRVTEVRKAGSSDPLRPKKIINY